MRLINDDGSLRFDYVCGCGKNRSVHDANCATLSVAMPVYGLRNKLLTVSNRWVLCRLYPNDISEYRWSQMFGSSLEYPKAVWEPCAPVYLEPGEIPTDQLTWEVIRAVRADRSKSAAQRDQEFMESVARKEKRTHDRILDDIKDSAPAFNTIPGKKAHVSFPSSRQ
jgi:hypothetical protein